MYTGGSWQNGRQFVSLSCPFCGNRWSVDILRKSFSVFHLKVLLFCSYLLSISLQLFHKIIMTYVPKIPKTIFFLRFSERILYEFLLPSHPPFLASLLPAVVEIRNIKVMELKLFIAIFRIVVKCRVSCRRTAGYWFWDYNFIHALHKNAEVTNRRYILFFLSFREIYCQSNNGKSIRK